MAAMDRSIFSRWLDGPHGPAAPGKRGVHFHGQFASWASLLERATELSKDVAPRGVYVVDPSAGLEAFVALLATAMTPGTMVVWGKRQNIPFALMPVTTGLFACEVLSSVQFPRPTYATLTSGTSDVPKIPIAYGDVLELVALQYDLALYQTGSLGALQ